MRGTVDTKILELKGRWLGLLLLGIALSATGCGTVIDLELAAEGIGSPHFYAGSRLDAGLVVVGDVPVLVEVPLLRYLDAPFSFVLDTALAPFTLPLSLLARNEVRRKDPGEKESGGKNAVSPQQ